jgi:PTH1 family peptidyl-tRNA hydrolase
LFLFVGLGNPEPRYAANRHNVGFQILDELAGRAGVALGERFQGRFGQGRLAGDKVLLLEPLTFMNRSGEAVAAAAQYFKVRLDETVIVHDEMDMDFGRLQLKRDGGSGGHNGLRSIEASVGSADFLRVRFGVGRPPPRWDPADWVLSDFDPDERKKLPPLLQQAADACQMLVERGMSAAMNQYNRRGL